MNDKDGMSKAGCPYPGARNAPPANRVHAWRRALAWAGIRSCLALLLAVAGGPARALEEPASDVPVAEHDADSPPTGSRLAPGVTFSGYGTLQLLAPDRRSREPLAGSTGQGRRGDGDGPGVDDPQSSQRARLNLSHLSGIVWWEPSAEWKVLGEVDLQDVVQVPHHDERDGPDSASFVALDRLYVDYHVTDSLTLRAGKFLTPIGRWNQEHSDPLVWTVLRPLISQSAFPTCATGLMLVGGVPLANQWLDYQVYAADGGDWRARPGSRAFDRAIGARLSTSLDRNFQLGVSFSRFDESDYASTRFSLVGVDAAWSWQRIEFSGETIVRSGTDGGTGNEHGGFAQVVVPIADRWWAVARLEAYRRAGEPAPSRTGLVGLVYKSGRHWVFKAEWASASGLSQGLPSGLLSSVTWVY